VSTDKLSSRSPSICLRVEKMAQGMPHLPRSRTDFSEHPSVGHKANFENGERACPSFDRYRHAPSKIKIAQTYISRLANAEGPNGPDNKQPSSFALLSASLFCSRPSGCPRNAASYQWWQSLLSRTAQQQCENSERHQPNHGHISIRCREETLAHCGP